jgi:hypothetical protein
VSAARADAFLPDQYQSLKVGRGPLESSCYAPSPPACAVDFVARSSPHADLALAGRYSATSSPIYHVVGGGELPPYVRPLPQRLAAEDVTYLFGKKALSIPDVLLRNALLRAYVEYVHPYMPLIALHDFLAVVDRGTGENGRLSLLLFQAVMFAGTAFVDMDYLIGAGYQSRKEARKEFYQKAKVSPFFSVPTSEHN